MFNVRLMLDKLKITVLGVDKNKEVEGVVINSLKELEALEELGKGTSGVVYKMVHKPSGKILAVKVKKLFNIFFFSLKSAYFNIFMLFLILFLTFFQKILLKLIFFIKINFY